MITFKHKLLFAFLFFIIIPNVSLGAMYYQLMSNTIKKNVSEQTIQTLKAIDLNLKTSLAGVNTFSDYAISSREVQYFLNNEIDDVIDFYENKRAVEGYLFSNANVEDFIIYNNSGNILSFRNQNTIPLDEFKKYPFFSEMENQDGRPYWLGPISNKDLLGEERIVLTQMRVIKDFNTLTDIGYLVLHMKSNLFRNIFFDHTNEKSDLLIVNKEGTVIYNKDHQFIGQPIPINEHNFITSGISGYTVNFWSGQKSLVTYYPSQSDWTLVSVTPWSLLLNETVFFRSIAIFAVLVGILFALMFNLLFMRKVTNFISEFSNKMVMVESGDLKARLPSNRKDELGHLSNGFNRMVRHIEELLVNIEEQEKRKRRAQFEALQSQINPHFLYNTLESINALAALNGQKQISKMIINLGKLFRISINEVDEVKVQNEIKHIISYLEIQKVRYNDRFEYAIDIEDKLKDQFILKIILQPLVENILYHGFEQKDNVGMITIEGRAENGRGCFYIQDNGTGISSEILKTFNENVNRSQRNEKMGHGLKNVYNRIKLFYGPHYGLTICSELGKGTTIKMTFPLNKGGVNNDL